MVRKRLKNIDNNFNCKEDCGEMDELKAQWREFIRSYKSSKRWFIGIAIALMVFIFGYTIEAYSTSRNSVRQVQLQEYVKTDEMLSWLLLEMEYVKKITLLNKAEVSDSLINDVFSNHKWMLEQFMEYNPRSMRNKPNYAKILNSYKKRNE